MITTTASDGVNVQAIDEGNGSTILILHPGLSDPSSWDKVAKRLAQRFRVVRVHRRQYRMDIVTGSPWSIAQEVQDVLAVAKLIGEPIVLVGHSSGGVVALEAMLASPSSFAGLVLYEPPIVLGLPLGGDAYDRAKAALDTGKPGKAIEIFVRDVVRLPPIVARLSGSYVALRSKYRRLAVRQIDDLGAINQLGPRLDAYSQIEAPTLLIGGDRSPVAPHRECLDALERTLPNAERIVLHNQGHTAHQRAPDELARVIATFADKVFHRYSGN